MIRAVVDTSIVVRAVLKPLATVGPVLDLVAEKRYKFLYSEATLEEELPGGGFLAQVRAYRYPSPPARASRPARPDLYLSSMSFAPPTLSP